MTKTYHANGKFLLTGEYAVTAGVRGLALPLKYGQHLEVTPTQTGSIHWTALQHTGKPWLDVNIPVEEINKGGRDLHGEEAKLAEVLSVAAQLNPSWDWQEGFKVTTRLDFDRHWGMGTSSTLISMVADWIGCDPYRLQFKCFGGSGYDIACAKARSPIVYQRHTDKISVEQIDFKPSIHSHLFFVYLNRKQNTRDSIASLDTSKLTEKVREELDKMPQLFVESSHDLADFEQLLIRHEKLISHLVGKSPVKEELFPDYPRVVKSLGGWGGDFVLATGEEGERNYFKQKGYTTIFNWVDLIP